MGWWAIPLSSLAPTHVEVELGCDNKIIPTTKATNDILQQLHTRSKLRQIAPKLFIGCFINFSGYTSNGVMSFCSSGYPKYTKSRISNEVQPLQVTLQPLKTCQNHLGTKNALTTALSVLISQNCSKAFDWLLNDVIIEFHFLSYQLVLVLQCKMSTF